MSATRFFKFSSFLLLIGVLVLGVWLSQRPASVAWAAHGAGAALSGEVITTPVKLAAPLMPVQSITLTGAVEEQPQTPTRSSAQSQTAAAPQLAGIKYDNTTGFSGSAFANGSAADQGGNGITRLVADDITLSGSLDGLQMTQFVFSVANLNSVAVSARPRVRFYAADGAGGGPGTVIVGYTFNAISFNPSNLVLLTANQILAFPAGTTTFWAGITFDNNTGATGATLAQLNNLGQGIFNPPTAGSSADEMFMTTAAGSFLASNPAGSLTNFGGTPAANFGWKFTFSTVCPIVVTSTADSGAGSLRSALVCATDGDTVTFNNSLAGQTIALTTSELVVTHTNLTIDGSGASGVKVDGNLAHRVFSVTVPLTIKSLIIQNGSVSGDGGGLYTTQAITLSGVTVYSNSVTNQGGGLWASGVATFMGGSFHNNQSGSFGAGFWANSALTLSGTQVLSNTVTGVAAAAGGVAVGYAWLDGGLFQGNVSNGGTGGLYANSGAAVTNTRFINNRAFAGGAGGLYLPGGNSRIVNSLFAGNYASNAGSALQIGTTGRVEIIHTTVVSPALGSDLAAIGVSAGTQYITNTLFSGYPVALWQTGGTLNEDYNLFDNVTNPYSGTIVHGGNSITGTADFVDPASDNYHLSAGSAAIDAGANAGITTDFDGDARPQGAGFDIGYDEVPQTCGVAANTNYPLSSTPPVTVNFSAPGTVNCVAAVYSPRAHANATGTPGHGVGADHFWDIVAFDSGGGAATGFTAAITVPYDSGIIGSSPVLCFYLGALGGYNWDCTGTQSHDGSTITRAGLTHFSDWAVGNAGPTAVGLNAFEATSADQVVPISIGLAALLALSIGAGIVIRRRWIKAL